MNSEIDLEFMTPQWRRGSASWAGTDAPMLIALAGDTQKEVRLVVAERGDVPLEALQILVQDLDDTIRAAALSNRRCNAAMLMAGSADKVTFIRSRVAGNPNCPPEALGRLVLEQDMVVRIMAASHPRCPPLALEATLWHYPHPHLRAVVAQNPNCSAETLKDLLDYDEPELVSFIISNPNCPEHLRVIAALGR